MAKYKFGDIIRYSRDLEGMVVRPYPLEHSVGNTHYRSQFYTVLIFRAAALKKGSIQTVHWTTDEDKSWPA